ATAPLYWLSAVRPLSDMAGLAAALVVLAVALHPRRLVLAAFLAGVAAGVRSQVLWLTLPFLALSIWRASATAVADGTPAARRRPGRLLRPAAAALAIGLLTWAIPLVLLSGGLRAYWHAFFDQASEDLSGVAMLWTTPTPRQAAIALQSAFIAPWALPATAVLVAALAAAGLGALVRRDRTALATIGATFGPYLLFDLLFQESVTTRYALPLVPPMAYLAARGAARLPSAAGLAVVACLVGWNLFVGIESAAAYARAPAPAFRMLADMAAAARASSAPATLAMDRRLDLDLRRPIRWIGDRVPGVGARLPAPPRREWLELVKYWNDPATAPDA